MSSVDLFHLFQDHHTTNSTDDGGSVNLAKGTAMAVLFTTSCALGALPIKLNQWFSNQLSTKDNTFIKILLGFGGGVLLCTTFMHLLPEVAEKFEELDLTPGVEIHYAQLLMCVGFFIMYFVEECVHVYLLNKQRKQDLRAITRSLSIRRGEIGVSEKEKDPYPIMTHHHEHSHADHSHIVVDISNKSTIAIIRGLLVVLALSIHELFEGLAVGLESSSSHVWYMFGAVSAHKMVIAFCIGVELVSSGLKTVIIVIYVFTFAVVSPMGIGIGIVLTHEGESSTELASVVLQGLASGTLLYVVFFEILQDDKKSGLRQYFAILFGFAVMFGVTLLD